MAPVPKVASLSDEAPASSPVGSHRSGQGYRPHHCPMFSYSPVASVLGSFRYVSGCPKSRSGPYHAEPQPAFLRLVLLPLPLLLPALLPRRQGPFLPAQPGPRPERPEPQPHLLRSAAPPAPPLLAEQQPAPESERPHPYRRPSRGKR